MVRGYLCFAFIQPHAQWITFPLMLHGCVHVRASILHVPIFRKWENPYVVDRYVYRWYTFITKDYVGSTITAALYLTQHPKALRSQSDFMVLYINALM